VEYAFVILAGAVAWRSCLWHAPAVVTNAIAMNYAHTFAASVVHSVVLQLSNCA
jgi:hypothetical protein